MRDSQRSSPVFHVGFHKTATKWLQRTIFSSEELGFYSPWKVGVGEVLDAFVCPRDGSFSRHEALKVFSNEIASANERGLRPVISNEDLCGYPVRGEYYGHQVAHRIHQVFPNAKILIGIREQKSMIFSMYQQYIRQYGSFRLEKYLGVDNFINENRALFKPEHLEFHLLVDTYQHLFGAKNVLVLPLEMLRQDRIVYLANLFRFFNFEASLPEDSGVLNASWSGLTLALRRRANAFLPSRPPGKGPGFFHRGANHLCYGMEHIAPSWANRAIEQKWKKVINGFVNGKYCESNSRLEGMTGLNLLEYGYDVVHE